MKQQFIPVAGNSSHTSYVVRRADTRSYRGIDACSRDEQDTRS